MTNAKQYVLSALMTCALGLSSVGAAQAQVRADFNGDGFDDLAMGAPGEEIAGDGQAGAVSVVYGTASGLHPLANPVRVQTFFQDQPGIVRELSEPGDNFGAALAAGDFNGDGFADLAIGAFGEDLPSGGVTVSNAGVVHVLYGSPSGLHDVNDQVWDQDSPGIFGVPGVNAFFGVSLAAADFNKDGFVDLAVGASGHSINGVPGVGAVIKINGSAAGLTAVGSQGLHEAAIFGIPQFAEANDGFGSALAAGDFGGDGFADLAIGIPGEDFAGNGLEPTDRGSVVVVYGSSAGLSFALRDEFNQDDPDMLDVAEPFDRFGSVLAAGDFSGDGRDDLAIGIPQEDLTGSTGNIINTGAVAVLYGSNLGGGLRVTGNQLWHQNAPGIEDINETGDFFGRSLTTGDFNGDGRDDLAIGVPFEDLGGSPNSGIQDAGVVEVIYGGAAGLTEVNDQRWNQNIIDFTTNTFIIDEAEAGDQFGLSIAAGDFNGDGRADLAVGVPAEDQLSVDNGAVHAIFGAANGLVVPDNQFLQQNQLGESLEVNDRFGAALAGSGSGSAGGAGFSGAWERLALHCAHACRVQGRLEVVNPGTAATDPSVVRLFLSADTVLDGGDLPLAEVTIGPLSPGASVHIRLHARIPDAQDGPERYVIAVLDADNVVPEINEDNNIVVSAAIQ